MKILFISDSGDKRGAQKSLLELILTMRNELGVEPILLTKKKNKMNYECDKYGIENYSVWYRYIMASSPYDCNFINIVKHFIGYISFYYGNFAKRKVDKIGIDFSTIDLIHTNTNRVDIGLYLSHKYDIPHVIHLREFGKEDFGSCIYLKNIYTDFNKNTDRFISISNCVKERWGAKGLDNNKIEVVYNGLDTKKYTIKKYNNKNEKVKIIIAGAINKYKGQMQLIEAINYLSETVKKNIEVSIVGMGKVDYINKIKRKIRKYKLDNIIMLEKYSNNLPQKLQEYDIGVITSKAEAFGRVTVEYMLCGLCVIASNTGANVELIKDGINGLIYEYDKPLSLAEKIESIYNNPRKMEEMGKEGYFQAKEVYTTQRNAKQIHDIYQEILSNK